MLPPYELLLKMQEDSRKDNEKILLNQDEIIVNQEYGNCLLELNQTV